MAIRYNDKQKNKGSTHEERKEARPSWGDNGNVRIPTQKYKDNWELIFGNKDKKAVDNT